MRAQQADGEKVVASGCIEQFSKKLEGLDLEPIVVKLIDPEHGEGWSLEKADTAVALYKQYLFLSYLYPRSTVVPNKTIDAVWHHHILDTQKYDDDCQHLFGYKLHHFPYLGMRGEDDKVALLLGFEHTRSLFTEHFGVELGEYDSFASTCAEGCGQSSCRGINSVGIQAFRPVPQRFSTAKMAMA